MLEEQMARHHQYNKAHQELREKLTRGTQADKNLALKLAILDTVSFFRKPEDNAQAIIEVIESQLGDQPHESEEYTKLAQVIYQELVTALWVDQVAVRIGSFLQVA